MRSLAVSALMVLIFSPGTARLPAEAGTSGIQPAAPYSSMVSAVTEQCPGHYHCHWVTVQACFQQANGKPTLGRPPHRGCAAYRIVIHFSVTYNGAAVAVDPMSVECGVREKHVAVHVSCQAVNAGERIFHHAGVIAEYAGPGYDSQIHVIVNLRGRVEVAASHGLAPFARRTSTLSPLVPGTPGALSVKVTRTLVPRNPIVTFSTTDPRLIGRLVHDLNALPRLYSINCPADRGPNYYLLFTYPHQASRLVTVDRSGCVDAGADHLPARTAIGTHFQIFSDLESIVLTDMRPPPPPRGQPPKHPRRQP